MTNAFLHVVAFLSVIGSFTVIGWIAHAMYVAFSVVNP